jgi:DNA recombination protein RmuC
VKKKLNEASNQIDKVAVRSRAIDRKLREVEHMPEQEATRLLALENLIQDSEDLLQAAE